MLTASTPKKLSVVVWRNEGLGALQAQSQPARGVRNFEVGGMSAGKGFVPVFESHDASPRAVTLIPTKYTVFLDIGPNPKPPTSKELYTDTGGLILPDTPTSGTRISLSPVCGGYDAQRVGRINCGYHFFGLAITNPSPSQKSADSGQSAARSRLSANQSAHSRAGSSRGGGSALSATTSSNSVPSIKSGTGSSSTSSAKDDGYIGGGNFVFTASSIPGVVCALWCTRHEKRHIIKRPEAQLDERDGDILVAELRIPVHGQQPPSERGTTRGDPIPASSWTCLLKDRQASLHIIRKGVDQCFSGENVQLVVQGAAKEPVLDRNGVMKVYRHFLTRDQAAEAVVSAVALSVLLVEHEGLEGPNAKWGWMRDVPAGAVRVPLAMPSPRQGPAIKVPVEDVSTKQEGLEGSTLASSTERSPSEARPLHHPVLLETSHSLRHGIPPSPLHPQFEQSGNYEHPTMAGDWAFGRDEDELGYMPPEGVEDNPYTKTHGSDSKQPVVL